MLASCGRLLLLVEGRGSGQQLPRDQQPLDLIGAFEDLGHLGVAIEPFDLEAADIAAAPEDLDGIRRADDGRIASDAFGDRAFQSGAAVAIENSPQRHR